MRDSNSTEHSDPERDIFSDPALSQGASDPVAEFIKRQWRPLLIVVVLAFALVYVRDAFRESRQRNLEDGANAFFESQEALKRYRETLKNVTELESKKEPTDTEKKDLETARAELKSREERVGQATLILAESAPPYNSFAAIINGLHAHDRGDIEAVKKALAVYDVGGFDKLKGADRFVAELGLLTMARSLLDSPDGASQARGILIALAQKGETAAVSAAQALTHIAATEQDRQEAREISAALIAKYPEQASILKE